MVDPETYHINILDEDSFTVSVDLSDDVRRASITSANDTDSVTFGKEDMSPLFVLRETRRVQDSGIERTICGAFKPRVSHGGKWTLLPILPTVMPCRFELASDGGAPVLPRTLDLDAVQQFLSFMIFDSSSKGLLPGCSRPLNDSLHIGVVVQQWPNVVSTVNTAIKN